MKKWARASQRHFGGKKGDSRRHFSTGFSNSETVGAQTSVILAGKKGDRRRYFSTGFSNNETVGAQTSVILAGKKAIAVVILVPVFPIVKQWARKPASF